MARLSTVNVLVVLLCATMVRGEAGGRGPRLAIVVGRTSTISEVSRDTLRDVYLRRQRVWADGARAIPVNLPPGNPLRERFSEIVLGRSTQELVPYWNAKYFEGITPPTVLPSPPAIRAYLKAEPGAIAYLSEEDVDDSCRALLWLEPSQ